MDSFFPFAFYVFYKLLALIPLILILIAIIKLHRKEKSTGIYLMLTGNIGLLSKVTIIDSLSDYVLRFSHNINVRNIGTIYSALNILTLVFSILFAAGFF